MKGFLRLKINKLKIFFFLVIGLEFCVFMTLAYFNVSIKKENSFLKINPNPLDFKASKYPKVLNPYEPGISAQGAVILDRNSQVVIFEKNPNLRFSPASTTKIMTALVALEYFNKDDILTIYQPDVEGSTLRFVQNEKFTFESLLYAMMLPSSNDATLAIAQNYPGGETAFVARMNDKARQFHLRDTHFDEPIGLLDEKDYTTPIDLARLASVALKNPTLAGVVSTKNRAIVSLSGNRYNLNNLNRLLDLPGVSGVKTGFTEGAGQVLVTSKKFENNDSEIVIVVMQSEDRFLDTQILLNYLDNNLNFLSSHP